jgi:3'-5' exoribonuclease 1
LKSELLFGCENPFSMIDQPFEYIAVVDFEATCEQNPGKNYRNEIIEFPIVLIDVKQQAIVNYYFKMMFIQ